ncbi:hypothetical protein [Pectobacterium wasabiae]|uniref:hypothetical protein n=1 Tax=Pectobacterium wasabiae TaxID=55208 RepID=UPI00027B0CBD|nr:hypothetical protein [Pectobacterium wasabiae]EJS96064.1 Hypothetical protein Y17_0696 [Pectobacterium wasabiae CFBP 3304]
MRHIVNYPDDIDFLSFFESEQSYISSDLQCVAYTVSNHGTTVEFSYNVTEGWVQVKLFSGEHVINQYLTEGVTDILLRKDKSGEYIFIEVVSSDLNTKIEIMWKPLISIKVTSLLNS